LAPFATIQLSAAFITVSPAPISTSTRSPPSTAILKSTAAATASSSSASSFVASYSKSLGSGHSVYSTFAFKVIFSIELLLF
jgi:hypothetical protein